MNILSLSNINKQFGNVVVADAISFAVEQGQTLGIIGPNGAGKSSLFNLITGNIQADSGSIHFIGQDFTHKNAIARAKAGIGRSFQIPQPFGKLSVFENLLVAAMYVQNSSENDVSERCAEILEQTQLLDHANKVAGSLTLLNRKRLELARAMAIAPKLLLLDEIAGGLTDLECVLLVNVIKSIQQSGTTIIWIEHVLQALMSVVDQLLVLNFGKVIAIGEREQIINSDAVKQIYLGSVA